ncbi:MAG: tRNA uridine-5-carboxymethylaminomethyl(34) synthesis GTPase MnmE [Clostridia bacterium]|nr:tRNA uridine-5-carboxymethylaminomethyl(34) synthesis GTPase MnmE [Clostridia bacterium]
MDTCIAAVCTPAGRGGIAVIRISGEGALDIGRGMFAFPDTVEPNYMYPGTIHGDGFTDFGYAVYFKAPRTFTGEDIVELHCHGGQQIADGILAKAISLGCRPADKGEYTKRAFLNGKLSLSSAEGMADMINAESLALLRAGRAMQSEKLAKKIVSVQDELKDILARIAVEIDYPEEDSTGDELNGIRESIQDVYEKVAILADSFTCGRKIKEGVSVAICGAPNAGKSSLLNALLGYDRAIVSSIAGTTRDTVDARLQIDGVLYSLTDTAGIREGAGEIESIGIGRAKDAAQEADVILSMTDNGTYADTPGSGTVIHVFNKSDIITPAGDYDIAVSAKTGEGLEDLKRMISHAAVGELSSSKLYIIEERHKRALDDAAESLKSCLDNFNDFSADILAVDLREAWESLGEITGETASEEIVSRVFEKFCVGK